MIRLAQHTVALLLGATVALSSVAVHRSELLGVPAGLLLAVGASGMLALVLRSIGRVGASYVVGWLVLLGLALTGRPEGDFVVASDLRGYGLMAAGLALVVLGVTALPARPAGPVGPRN